MWKKLCIDYKEYMIYEYTVLLVFVLLIIELCFFYFASIYIVN